MKKLTALLLGCMLMATCAFAEQPSDADKKWLEAVEKMVTNGKNEISTPDEKRVNLLKEWAEKKGYAAQVNKHANGYRIELTKSVAKK